MEGQNRLLRRPSVRGVELDNPSVSMRRIKALSYYVV
jgi:hypothetical protein